MKSSRSAASKSALSRSGLTRSELTRSELTMGRRLAGALLVAAVATVTLPSFAAETVKIYRSTMPDGSVVLGDKPSTGARSVATDTIVLSAPRGSAEAERDYWRREAEAFNLRQQRREAEDAPSRWMSPAQPGRPRDVRRVAATGHPVRIRFRQAAGAAARGASHIYKFSGRGQRPEQRLHRQRLQYVWLRSADRPSFEPRASAAGLPSCEPRVSAITDNEETSGVGTQKAEIEMPQGMRDGRPGDDCFHGWIRHPPRVPPFLDVLRVTGQAIVGAGPSKL